jgi:protein TonB
VLAALAINALLVGFIHQLVHRNQGTLAGIEGLQAIEFVRFIPEPQRPSESPRSSPRQPIPPPEPAQTLTQPLRSEPARPRPPRLALPRLHLDLPGIDTGGPYLGDLRPAPTPQGLDAGTPVFQVPPLYPPRARRAGIEGAVTVEFTITPDGSVKDPEVVSADPPRVFDRAVLRAIRRWRFDPRRVDGRAVEWRARKQITFRLEGR